MRRNWLRPVAVMLALAVGGPFTLGCYGKFALLKKVYDWNGTLGNKFVVWLVFLVLNFIPVYGIAAFIDSLILNSLEFWTGSNPMTASLDGKPAERMVQKDGKTMQMTALDKDTIRVRLTDDATGAAQEFSLQRNALGIRVLDAQGALLGSSSLDGAGLEVKDAQGQSIAWRTPGQVDALERAAAHSTGALLVAIEAQDADAGMKLAKAH